jgi:hypothetical protein
MHESQPTRRMRAAPIAPILGLTLHLMPVSAAAQDGAHGTLWLPRERFFESPFAEALEPRMGLGLKVTNLLEHPGDERPPFDVPSPRDARSDWQASVAIGGTIPFWRHRSDRFGILVAGQAGVFARFRIERPSRDDLGQDWFVGLPIEMTWGDLAGRIRIGHRSSHLGDEFVESTGAERVETGGEAIDALAAWTLPLDLRLYAGGSWIFRSYTKRLDILRDIGRRDRFLLQIGTDGDWQPFADDRLHIVAGADWQSAERTGWRAATAIAAGVQFRSANRSVGLVARYFEGVSALGQFFLTSERYVALELLATF